MLPVSGRRATGRASIPMSLSAPKNVMHARSKTYFKRVYRANERLAAAHETDLGQRVVA